MGARCAGSAAPGGTVVTATDAVVGVLLAAPRGARQGSGPPRLRAVQLPGRERRRGARSRGRRRPGLRATAFRLESHGSIQAPDVARLVARGNVEGLVKAAKYKRDPEVQRQAREALCEMIDFLHPRAADPQPAQADHLPRRARRLRRTGRRRHDLRPHRPPEPSPPSGRHLRARRGPRRRGRPGADHTPCATPIRCCGSWPRRRWARSATREPRGR